MKNGKICGIKIESNRIILVLLEGTKKNFNYINTKITTIELQDHSKQDSINSFKKTIETFFTGENVSKVFIKGRNTKGKFAGGAISFKIEAIIQLISVEVNIVSPTAISALLKKKLVNLDIVKHKYQSEAIQVAYYGMEE